MLSWLPLIGPILQGLGSTAVSLYSTFKSTEVEQIKAGVTDAQTSAQIIRDTNDDICLRLLRDAALVFPILWSAIIGWDTVVAYHYPELMWRVPDYPVDVRYIPYGAFAFLFGLLGFKVWKNK